MTLQPIPSAFFFCALYPRGDLWHASWFFASLMANRSLVLVGCCPLPASRLLQSWQGTAGRRLGTFQWLLVQVGSVRAHPEPQLPGPLGLHMSTPFPKGWPPWFRACPHLLGLWRLGVGKPQRPRATCKAFSFFWHFCPLCPYDSHHWHCSLQALRRQND